MSLSQIINQIIEFIKKHKIISGLIIIFIIFLFFLLTQPTPPKTEKPIQKINISPTPIVLESKTEPFDVTNSDPDYPLQPFLPYKGPNFTITSYIAPLVIEVQIKNKQDIPNVEPLLKNWLKDKELMPGENKIIWKYEQ